MAGVRLQNIWYFFVDLSQTPANTEISPTKVEYRFKTKAVDQFGNNTSILVNTPLMIYSAGFFSSSAHVSCCTYTSPTIKILSAKKSAIKQVWIHRGGATKYTQIAN